MQVFANHKGEAVYEAVLTSNAGVSVSILSLGAIVRDWRVPRRDGSMRSVTLGFDDFEPYIGNEKAFGIVAGRIANRVRNGRFSLDGTDYQLDLNMPPDHIHGGAGGLGKRVWQMESDGQRARLTCDSPDGEMGYPGTVSFAVEIALSDHTVTFHMTAAPDRPTPIALAQHSYYHLGGPVGEHTFQVAADKVTELGPRKIPTGAIVDTGGTPLDFRRARALGDTEMDINYCLESADPAAVLTGADYRLELRTDRPGLQIYNGYDFKPMDSAGHDGRRYGPFPGIALEAQDFPDAINHPAFPSVVCTPQSPYRQTTSVTVVPL
ncbi:MAG: aldose epimerase family protein [Pseudomonadota bacterium]